MYPHQLDRLSEVLDAAGARALVATSSANVRYVTGFSSPVAAVAPAARFGVFTRHGTALVLPAADVPAALDARADADHVIGFGRLAVVRPESRRADARRIEEIIGQSAGTSAAALTEALARLGVADGPVAVDEGGMTSTGWRAVSDGLAAMTLVPGSEHFSTARRVKSPYELERCADALRIAEESLDAVIQVLERGTTELDAARLYATEVVRRGAVPTWASVAMGERTWIPMAWPTDQALRPGALVRLDVGCAHRGYCASVARTAVLGEPAPRVWDVYGALHAALEAATAVVTDGTPADRVLAAALDTASSLGIAAEDWTGAGHGIGLEPREAPTLDASKPAPLAAGEVLCLELPYGEIGSMGIGIRNTVLVTTAGARALNQSRHDLVVLD